MRLREYALNAPEDFRKHAFEEMRRLGFPDFGKLLYHLEEGTRGEGYGHPIIRQELAEMWKKELENAGDDKEKRAKANVMMWERQIDQISVLAIYDVISMANAYNLHPDLVPSIEKYGFK